MMALSVAFLTTLVLFIYSIILFGDAYQNPREKELAQYLNAELLWNSTYRAQFENVDISLILDHDLYLQNKDSLAQARAQLEAAEQDPDGRDDGETLTFEEL